MPMPMRSTLPAMQQQQQMGMQVIVEGYLLMKSNYEWEMSYFVFHGSTTTGNFKMTSSHSPGKKEATKGVIDGIHTSLSCVFITQPMKKNQPVNWANNFVLQVNKYNKNTTFLFATDSEADLHRWINALQTVLHEDTGDTKIADNSSNNSLHTTNSAVSRRHTVYN